MLKQFRQQKGLCLIEFAIMAALFLGVLVPALVVVIDNVLDILNDFAEDLDVIDDFVSNLDLDGIAIESNEDDDPEDL